MIIKIEEKIDKYEYISFDLFGTLLVRNVKREEDVFYIVGKWLEKNSVSKDFWNNNSFETIRANAYKEAVKRKGENCSLLDIYSFVPEKVRKEAMDAELLIEEKVIVINEKVYEIYKKEKNNNKKIIIITDMYLPAYFLNKLLEKNDITYEKMYISSEVDKNKRTGSLYRFVLKDLGINSKKIIHFGDRRNSDYYQAKKNGIDACLIKKHCKVKFYDNAHVFENMLIGIINNTNSRVEYTYNIGYSCLGPVLLSFCLWLDRKISDEGIDKVVFLAREGKLIQEAYNIIKTNNKPNAYLEVSRRSLAPLKIVDAINEDIIDNMSLPREVTLGEIADLWNLPTEGISTEIITKRIEREQLINDKESRDIVNKWLQIIKKDAAFQKNIITQYLDSFIKQNRKVAVVDIGWRGSMQLYLNKYINVTNNKNEIIGYYLGLNKNHHKEINAEGFLFDGDESLEDKIMGAVGLVEAMFFPKCGSVKEYRKINNYITPMYQHSEMDEDSYQVIGMIQKGALDFIRNVNKMGINNILQLDVNYVIRDFLRLITTPSLNELVEFEKISFNNGAGIGNLVGYDKKACLYDKLKNFKNSGWKIGYLKKMIKLPLNYAFIYSCARNIALK